MPLSAEELAAQDLARREKFTPLGGVSQIPPRRQAVSPQARQTAARVEAAKGRRAQAAKSLATQNIITGGLKALSTVAYHRDKFLRKLNLHRK